MPEDTPQDVQNLGFAHEQACADLERSEHLALRIPSNQKDRLRALGQLVIDTTSTIQGVRHPNAAGPTVLVFDLTLLNGDLDGVPEEDLDTSPEGKSTQAAESSPDSDGKNKS